MAISVCMCTVQQVSPRSYAVDPMQHHWVIDHAEFLLYLRIFLTTISEGFRSTVTVNSIASDVASVGADARTV